MGAFSFYSRNMVMIMLGSWVGDDNKVFDLYGFDQEYCI